MLRVYYYYYKTRRITMIFGNNTIFVRHCTKQYTFIIIITEFVMWSTRRISFEYQKKNV